MAEVEAEIKMGTKFSSKVFLWMLTSSSCRLANKAVVPFTKVSIFYSSNVFFNPIFLYASFVILCVGLVHIFSQARWITRHCLY